VDIEKFLKINNKCDSISLAIESLKFENKELRQEVQQLKTCIEDMKTELAALTKAVTSQTALIKKFLKRDSSGVPIQSAGMPKYSQEINFPLRSENDLIEIDMQITLANRQSYVSTRK